MSSYIKFMQFLLEGIPGEMLEKNEPYRMKYAHKMPLNWFWELLI